MKTRWVRVRKAPLDPDTLGSHERAKSFCTITFAAFKKKETSDFFFLNECSAVKQLRISTLLRKTPTYMWGSYSWSAPSAACWEQRKETKRFCFETPDFSVFLRSGVASLCDNRDAGVDAVGEWRTEMPPGVLEHQQVSRVHHRKSWVKQHRHSSGE